MEDKRKGFSIESYGCQMNEYDSEVIAGMLEELGYGLVDAPDFADIIILNTCSVRQKPEHKVYSRLGELRKFKERKPSVIIGVAGCMAQKEGENILARAPWVDLLIGPNSLQKLPELISEIQRDGKSQIALSLEDERSFSLPIHRMDGLKAWVPIVHGCDNFCAYCIVPYVRGRERSRPPEEVIAEVRGLAEAGYKEITLLGQNVNAYKGESRRTKDEDGKQNQVVDFPDLLSELNEIEGIERIRFTTSHPRDVTDEFIEAVANLSKVCEWFHLPIQSGDDEILKRMNRGYTVKHYLNLIHKIRQRIPEASITTDIMVGFPGETEEQFENTLKVVETIQFDQAFMFAYSPREGTKAADMPDQLPKEVKQERLEKLVCLQNQISRRKNERLLGKTFEVLVEGPSEKDKQKLSGRTRNNKLVIFDGSASLIGELVQIKTTKAFLWGFEGEVTLHPKRE